MQTPQALEIDSFATPGAIFAALQRYVDAARAGSGSTMRSAFAEQARVAGSYGSKPVSWSVQEFCDLIDGKPASELQARIVSVEHAGNAAMARLEALNWRGTRYTDFFVLTEQGGEWLIAAKVFFAHSRA